MKKLLILSYHFTPQNNIASRRTEAYAFFLKQFNIYPTIITHDFTPDGYPIESDETKIETYDNYTVIRIPFRRTYAGSMQSALKRFPRVLNLFNLGLWSIGHLDTLHLDSYFSYRKFLWKHLSKAKYDMVLAVYSPSDHVRIASKILSKFEIPYAVDYRDLWDNSLLMRLPYKPSIGRRALNNFSKIYHKRWLRRVSFITSVSQPLVDFLKDLTVNKRCYRITNGFEDRLFKNLRKTDSSKFLVVHGGTIYKDQNLMPFIEGVKIFWQRLQAEERRKFGILMIGSRNDEKMSQMCECLPDVQIEVSSRKSRTEALQLMKNASILFYPGFATHRGVYSGKIFEYLGLGNNILVTPTDNDVVEELIQDTRAGIATSDPEVVASYLKDNFDHWKEYGDTKYNGNATSIYEYSRESQVARMATLINDSLRENH